MKVKIDPTVRELFFERLTDICGDRHKAIEWFERIAYGEQTIVTDEINKEFNNLKAKLDFFKKLYYKGKEVNRQLRMDADTRSDRYRNMDNEVDGYMEEIKYYRNVLLGEGLGHHIDDYEEEGEFD